MATRIDGVQGDPSPEEVAAIAAAIELAWPRPVVDAGAGAPEPSTWRFSGRWWARPVATRRMRPWAGPIR
jgi:hypothetical protein